MKESETVRFATSVLCKIIARKDMIFNELFQAPTIARLKFLLVNVFDF